MNKNLVLMAFALGCAAVVDVKAAPSKPFYTQAGTIRKNMSKADKAIFDNLATKIQARHRGNIARQAQAAAIAQQLQQGLQQEDVQVQIQQIAAPLEDANAHIVIGNEEALIAAAVQHLQQDIAHVQIQQQQMLDALLEDANAHVVVGGEEVIIAAVVDQLQQGLQQEDVQVQIQQMPDAPLEDANAHIVVGGEDAIAAAAQEDVALRITNILEREARSAERREQMEVSLDDTMLAGNNDTSTDTTSRHVTFNPEIDVRLISASSSSSTSTETGSDITPSTGNDTKQGTETTSGFTHALDTTKAWIETHKPETAAIVVGGVVVGFIVYDLCRDRKKSLIRKYIFKQVTPPRVPVNAAA